MNFTSFKRRFLVFHLGISFVVALVLLLVIFFKWFPYPLFFIDGTWAALITLLIVDLVLGPFLCWLVISDKKKRVQQWIDVSVIICIQIAAMVFGIKSIYDQRIVALVFLDDLFHLVSYQSARKADFENINLKYYKNIAYGGLTQGHFDSEIKAEIERKLYNPEEYDVFNNDILRRSNPQNVVFSKEILKKYEGKKVYKVAGKKRNGIAVLDSDYNIVELILDDISIEDSGKSPD